MTHRALLIGINDYVRDPLEYAVADATDLYTALTSPPYTYACTLLTDAHATKSESKEAVETLLLDEALETGIIFFAGHAAATDYGAFLITHDTHERADDGFDLTFLTRMIQGSSYPH